MEWLAWPTGLIAAAVAIPLLVVMYFLKLRRTEVPISSTLLWKRAVQDLQVNAPFQRLRRNLLLLLQLICLALILLSLARPMLSRKMGQGRRYVILIDRSGSMSATDVKPTRLDEAKRQAKELVEDLRSPSMFGLGDEGDQAMVIAFDDRAKVMCNFTADKHRLTEAVDSIAGTDGPSALDEAISVARAFAQGAGEEANNRSALDRAQLELFSDGRIADAASIAIDEGEVVFHRIGAAGDNVGVVAMQARRSFEQIDDVTVFATLANYAETPVTRQVQLSLNENVRSVRQVAIPARTPGQGDRPPRPGKTSISFALTHSEGAVVEVRKLGADALAG
ncbi:MAG: VWA domain-containing protein, partial [Planctomycetota bacterium]